MNFILTLFLFTFMLIGNSAYTFGKSSVIFPDHALWEGNYYALNDECPNEIKLRVYENIIKDKRCPGGKKTSIIGTFDASFGSINVLNFSSINCGIINSDQYLGNGYANETSLMNTSTGQSAYHRKGHVKFGKINWKEKNFVSITVDGELYWQQHTLPEGFITCNYKKR